MPTRKVPTRDVSVHEVCVGIGLRSDVPSEVIVAAVQELVTAGWLPVSLATLNRRSVEDSLVDAANRLRLPITGFDADQLASVPVPNPSRRVNVAVGSPSVAEAAAILGSGGGPLVVAKRSANGVVLAAARKVS